MTHSNTSLNCFTNCMAKYEQIYILHNEPNKPSSPHLTFGTMGHEVLYNAGTARDNVLDNVDFDYASIIPSELQYNDLKEFFGIRNWYNYFTKVIDKVTEYETDIVKQMSRFDAVTVEREVKLQLTSHDLAKLGVFGISDPIVGVVDLLVRNSNYAFIVDYKFSNKIKDQDDFDMNSQLQLYAFLVHIIYNIPLYNIQIGYIDIPKCDFDEPTILKNGTISKSKSQCVTADAYEQAVIAQHGDDTYYNCEIGGYYHEIWQALQTNKVAYFNHRYLDLSIYNQIVGDLVSTAQTIEKMQGYEMPFLRKYDTYSCKNCEYLNSCKSYLNAGDEE